MKSFYFFLLFFIFSITAFAQNLHLEVEPNHSTVGFRLSISGFTEVTGKFGDYAIEAAIDSLDFTKSRFSAVIQAASINTGIPDRDDHLRTADFFDVENFPEITFTTDSIRQVNYAQFIAHGQFTMHGITRALDLPFTIIKKERNTVGFKIRTVINRLDYKVGESFAHTDMEDFLAKDIQIEIDFWTRKKKKKKTIAMEKNKPFLGLRTCIYMVGDLDAAKDWYTKAFDTAPYFDEPFYVGFNIGGYELGLLPEEKPNAKKPDTILTYWGVENIQEVYDKLIKLGATEHEAPHSVGDPLLVATVKDPWGNLVGMIYNPVFKLDNQN